MRKRIKHFLEENEEIKDSSMINLDQDPNYISLLIEDLKKEAERMPVYSMWHDVVKKCLTGKSPSDN